jgi:hypothetical protein
MIGYIVGILLLYLFLKFQIDKIRNPTQPNQLTSYTKWIEDLKESVKPNVTV